MLYQLTVLVDADDNFRTDVMENTFQVVVATIEAHNRSRRRNTFRAHQVRMVLAPNQDPYQREKKDGPSKPRLRQEAP